MKPPLEYSQVEKMLKKLDVPLIQTKEQKGYFEVDGVRVLRIGLPPPKGAGKRRELSNGAAHKLLSDLRIPRPDFMRLYQCPMTRAEYIAKLQSMGIISDEQDEVAAK